MKLKTILRILTTPSCWIRNHKTDLIWDMKLNQLLDKYDFADIEEHTARLGDQKVWIKNHPFASFSPYNRPYGPLHVLPKRETVFRAHDKLVRQMVNV